MSGGAPPSMTGFIAAPPAAPGLFPPGAPGGYPLVGPDSARAAARASPWPATNAVTFEPISRAFVSSSWVADVGVPSVPCANTQTLEMAMMLPLDPGSGSDDLELVEELDDLRVALAVVLDDLA